MLTAPIVSAPVRGILIVELGQELELHVAEDEALWCWRGCLLMRRPWMRCDWPSV